MCNCVSQFVVSFLSQLSRMKAKARLALLSDSVTGIDLWLHTAMTQAEEELERERRLSEQRKSTEDFSVCTNTCFTMLLTFIDTIHCLAPNPIHHNLMCMRVLTQKMLFVVTRTS